MKNIFLGIIFAGIVGTGVYFWLNTIAKNANQAASVRQIQINALTE